MNKRILIVDDALFLGEGLKRALRGAGLEAVSTNDGNKALRLARSEKFDAVLTDLRMPAMSGEDLIKQLNLLEPTLPCIIMTGHATKESVMTLAREPNVAGILVKPLDYARLFTMISKVLGVEVASASTPQAAAG